MNFLYGRNTFEAKNLSAVWDGAYQKTPCDRCHNTHEDRVICIRRSRRMVEEMNDTRRKIKDRQAEATSLDGRDSKVRRREVHREIVALLSLQSPAK